MIELGQKAKDKITGFEGIITGRASYLYGCDQYCLVPSVGTDGKMAEGQWFDEGRVLVTGPGVNATDVMVEKPGGPNLDWPRG